MAVVPITTERLRIRALVEGDVDAVFAIVGDPDVANGASWLQPDLESCHGYVARRMANEADHGFSIWAVERLIDDHLIGVVGYIPHGEEIEMAYAFRRDCRGRGYGTEAAGAALEASLPIGRRVYATIRSTNAASLAVASKIGLVHRDEIIEDERGIKLIFRWP